MRYMSQEKTTHATIATVGTWQQVNSLNQIAVAYSNNQPVQIFMFSL